MILHARPAYGRVYKTKADVRKDWDLCKDFQLRNGTISKSQRGTFLRAGFTFLHVRFGEEVAIISLGA